MTNPYFKIPDSEEIIYNGDRVILSEYPDNVAIASYGWYNYENSSRKGWYFLLLPLGTVIPEEDVDLSLIKPDPNPQPCPPEPIPPVPGILPIEDRVFITVDTIAQRDSLVDEFLPDGRIVRVNDTGSGQYGYYQWDSVNQEWVSWDISYALLTKQNKAVYSYQFLPPYLADKRDYFEVGDVWTVRNSGLRSYMLIESPSRLGNDLYWYSWRPVTQSYLGESCPAESTFVDHYDYSPQGINAPTIHYGIDVPPYFDGEFVSDMYTGSGIIAGRISYLASFSWNIQERKYYYKWIDIATLPQDILAEGQSDAIKRIPKGQLFFLENDEVDTACRIKSTDVGYSDNRQIMAKEYTDKTYPKITVSQYVPPVLINKNIFKLGDIWIYKKQYDNTALGIYVLKHSKYDTTRIQTRYQWEALYPKHESVSQLPSGGSFPYRTYTSESGNSERSYPLYVDGDIITVDNTDYRCKVNQSEGTTNYTYTFSRIPSSSDTYTKTEVDNLLSAISTLSFQIVESLPTEDIRTDIIYLVPNSESETQNVYDEWIYANDNWELIGTTRIDLSDYKKIYYSNANPPYWDNSGIYSIGELWINYSNGTTFALSSKIGTGNKNCIWNRVSVRVICDANDPPTSELQVGNNEVLQYYPGDIWIKRHYYSTGVRPFYTADDIYICVGSARQSTPPYNQYNITWCKLARAENTYTKSEIDTMIGDIESLLSEV